jgi:hypothetical protein
VGVLWCAAAVDVVRSITRRTEYFIRRCAAVVVRFIARSPALLRNSCCRAASSILCSGAAMSGFSFQLDILYFMIQARVFSVLIQV